MIAAVEPSRRVTRLLTFETPAPISKQKLEKKEPQLDAPSNENSATTNTNNITSSNSNSSTINVVLRIRPFSDHEKKQQTQSCILPSTNPTVLKLKPNIRQKHPPLIRESGMAAFKFSNIFAQESTQEQVFETTTLPLISHLFQGDSTVVFAYGVTSSGKTYTIQGTQDSPGILPRSLDVIMNSIAMAKGKGLAQDSTVSQEVAELTDDTFNRRSRRQRNNVNNHSIKHDANYVQVDSKVEYSIYASYLEIYNDLVYDLFDKSSLNSITAEENDQNQDEGDDESFKMTTIIKRPSLKLKERLCRDSMVREKEVYAEGQTEVLIKSVVDIERLLEFGCNNRTVAHTRSNSTSSRSHAIFEIKLNQKIHKPNGRYEEKTSRLQIVDLAGSEKLSKSSSHSINRSNESRQINTSLMNLSRCLETLRKNQKQSLKKIVPFRDSKLTRLLQRSLSTGFAVMVATMSPSLNDADETIHTLRNTAIAREIKLKSVPVHKRTLISAAPTNETHTAKREPTVRSAKKFKNQQASRKILKEVGNIISNTNSESSKTDILKLRQKNGGTGNNEKYIKNVNEYKEKLRKLNEQLEEYLDEKNEMQQKMKKYERIALLAENAYCEQSRERERIQLENEKLYRENERIREKLAHAEAKTQSLEYELRLEITEQVEQGFKNMTKRYEDQIRELRSRCNSNYNQPLIMDSFKFESESLKRKVMRSSTSAFQSIARELQHDDDDEEEDDNNEEDELNEDGDAMEEDYTVYEEED